MNVIVFAIPVFVVLMAAEFAAGATLALIVGLYAIVYNYISIFTRSASDGRVRVGALVAYGRRRSSSWPRSSRWSARRRPFSPARRALWVIGALIDRRVSMLEALFAFAAALTSAAYSLGWPTVELVMKPLALALLIASFVPRAGEPSVKRLVLAALAASLVGDVLLLSPSLFAPGLVTFLIAHLFYIAAFSRRVGFLPSRIAVAAIGLFAALVFAALWPGVGGVLRIPVAIYAAVLAVDAAQAAGRATVLRDGPAIAVAVGAIAFMLSDMTIAIFRFGRVGWPVDQATLPTYYLAQGLIVFFVLPRGTSHA